MTQPSKRSDYFGELLDTLLPGLRGKLIVLKAYFDASSRTDGTFCVSGFAFEKRKVKKFDAEWWELFGEYGGCHMRELAHRRGRFKGISQDESVRLIKAAIKIIKRRMSFGVTISCDLNEINAILPTWINGFQHAYPVCCHMAMQMLGRLVQRVDGNNKIAYFFENGDSFSGVAHNFMMNAGKVPALRDAYLYGSHTFIDKKDALSLQAADVFAWEWAKYIDETRGKNIRRMRKSLAELLAKDQDLDLSRYSVTHITGEPLRRFARKASELGLMQIKEDEAAKNQRRDA